MTFRRWDQAVFIPFSAPEAPGRPARPCSSTGSPSSAVATKKLAVAEGVDEVAREAGHELGGNSSIIELNSAYCVAE
jgi:hypothetical protein